MERRDVKDFGPLYLVRGKVDKVEPLASDVIGERLITVSFSAESDGQTRSYSSTVHEPTQVEVGEAVHVALNERRQLILARTARNALLVDDVPARVRQAFPFKPDSAASVHWAMVGFLLFFVLGFAGLLRGDRDAGTLSLSIGATAIAAWLWIFVITRGKRVIPLRYQRYCPTIEQRVRKAAAS